MKYDIPITYQCLQTVSVEADNLEQAVILALKQFLSEPDENYLCDSFEIDSIIEDSYPLEDYNYTRVWNSI